jgi:hypothetical protein
MIDELEQLNLDGVERALSEWRRTNMGHTLAYLSYLAVPRTLHVVACP